jgi:Fe-S-cluster containining protein
VSSEGLRFECTQCGQCCTRRGEYGYVYLNDREVVAIARHLGLLPMEFRRRYTFVDEYGWTQIVLEDRCVFLDPATNRCRVYPARPTQCRTFPFWRDLVVDGGWSDEARALCEGIGRGPLHQIEDVAPLMREMEAEQEE